MFFAFGTQPTRSGNVTGNVGHIYGRSPVYEVQHKFIVTFCMETGEHETVVGSRLNFE